VDRNAPPSPKKQIRRNRAQITQILEEFRQSGLTQREFAESRDFAVSSLVFWLRQERLQGNAQAPAKEPSAPVPAWVQAVPVPEPEPLPRPAPSSQSKPFHLRLPNGLRLRIPADFDAASLRRLLKALEATAR
jgi:hypothetical protein